MLPIYICDDNKKLLNTLEEYIKTYMGFSFENIVPSIHSFSNPEDFLNDINNITSTGIYFLDIDFKRELTGLDLASEIRHKDPLGFIVFVSTHEKYIPETYSRKLSAIDYIIKDKGDLKKQINSVLKTIFTRYQKMVENSEIIPSTLVLNLRNSTEIFEQNLISYIETIPRKHNTIIYHGTGMTKVPCTLTEMYKRLDKKYFIMCNRSEIVNILHIKKIDNDKKELTLKNGKIIKISRRLMSELSDMIINNHSY